MKLYPTISLIAAAVCYIFAILVFLNGKRNTQNRAFCFATMLTGTWALFPFLTSLPEDNLDALAIARGIYFFASFVPTAWFYFMINVLGCTNENRKFFAFFCISLFFSVISFSPFMIKYVIRFAPNFSPQAAPLFFLFILFFVVVFAEILIKLFSAVRRAAGHRRSQLVYISWAYFIGAISGILHFVSAYTGKEPFPHDILLIIYPCILSYAILRYRLLDITVTITRTGVFAAVYSIVLGLPFVAATAGRYWLIKFLGINWWVGPLVLMAILATVGPFIYIYLHKRAEAILLRQQREYQGILKQSAIGISRIRHLKELLNFITNVITENVRISHMAIYLFDVKKERFVLRSGRHLRKNQPIYIDKKSPLISWFENQKDPLVYEEVKQKSENETAPVFKELEKQMRGLNADVILASFLEDRLVDIFILGSKYLGKSYTVEDLNVFSVLSSEAALAIENALLYENIEEQVRERTKELVEMQKQLIQAEKLATVGTLAGGVAHEINNPLTAILINAQMLLADAGSINPESKKSVELIEEAAKRCRTIVQKLMAYAKKPLEQTQVSKINLSNVVKSVVSFLSYQFEQENIKIIADFKDNDYLINGNQNEIEQILTNLILNAKDAIKQLKKNGKIQVSLFKNADWIGFEVKDEGMGIAKEIITKIFDPFFTTKDVGKGTGLGLSICQTIAERHHGRIMVQSEVKKGAIFTVQFPRINESNKLELELASS